MCGLSAVRTQTPAATAHRGACAVCRLKVPDAEGSFAGSPAASHIFAGLPPQHPSAWLAGQPSSMPSAPGDSMEGPLSALVTGAVPHLECNVPARAERAGQAAACKASGILGLSSPDHRCCADGPDMLPAPSVTHARQGPGAAPVPQAAAAQLPKSLHQQGSERAAGSPRPVIRHQHRTAHAGVRPAGVPTVTCAPDARATRWGARMHA